MHTASPADLYRAHLDTLRARADRALAASGHDHLLIASGVEKYTFLDDRSYPFKPNPHFKHWLPLQRHPHCWLAYTPGRTPVLAYYQPDDYWHVPPAPPSGDWVAHFDVRVIRSPEEAARHLPSGRAAIIGEDDAALPGFAPNNPRAVLDLLHFHRACKTPWELGRMRQAQRRAVAGHLAARAAFGAGGSERDIHRAYLAATGHGDLDLPYGNIVALNAHGAVLHYQYQDADAPVEHRSLLIDAGAEADGYAADITRTWSNGDDDFQALVDAVEAAQLALCDRVRAAVDYREIHLEAHRRLAGILHAQGIVAMDPEAQLASGVSSTFFPHGIGHLIGLQVHDVGGFQASETGGTIDKPEGHPFLRLTRTLQPGMVVTIEPGIYFIDSLLAKLRARPEGKAVDWDKVAHLARFGGVRIEDEVLCTEDTPENLSREAFAAA